METIYDAIYEKAKPYLNTRQNDVHIPMAYEFGLRLVAFYPQADRDIVLPAIILHDVGWKMVPEEQQVNAFGPDATDMETQRTHEVEGVKIAAWILASVGYDEEKTREIVTIIEGHDSRPEALSLNDALVKDADKLCRFTPVGVDMDYVRFRVGRDYHLRRLATFIDGYFFTAKAKEMARSALAEAGRVDRVD
jgi:hypothetical protein